MQVADQQMHTYVVCRRVNQTGELDPLPAVLSTRGAQTPVNYEIWKAGRATSAAPTYFEPQDILSAKFVDGGLGYNNPIQTISDQYAHLGFQPNWMQRICYVSIGTGKLSRNELDRSRQYWRRFQPFGLSLLLRFLACLPRSTPGAQLAGYLNDQQAWDALMIPAVEENTHLSFSIKICTEGQLRTDIQRYFRFNCDNDFDKFDEAHGLSDIALDEYRKLQNIRVVTNNYIQREAGKIGQCASQLRDQAGTIAFV